MKIRKGSLSEFILLALEKTVDGLIRYDDLIHHPSSYAWRGRWDRQLGKSLLSQALKRLREKGLVEYEESRTRRVILKLTSLGKNALGDISALEKEWDGIFRIVIFDIPESKSSVRNLFRRRLKDWGFRRWQQSVWLTKNNVTERLRRLIDKLGIGDWVAIIESKDPSLKNIIS